MKRLYYLIREMFYYHERNKRLEADLRYVEDLLVEEATNNEITAARQGEINAMVAFIKDKRSKELKYPDYSEYVLKNWWGDRHLEFFKDML